MGISSFTSINVIYKKLILKKKDIDGKINEIDIIKSFTSLTIHEDVQIPLLRGSIIFVDTLRLYEHSPFTGNEEILLVMESTLSKGLTVELNFSITNFELSTLPKADQKIVVKLDLVQNNWKYFLEERSVSYSKSKYSNIAKFFQKYGKVNLKYEDILIEEADDTVVPESFCFPYMTFLDKIYWTNLYYKSKNNIGYCFYNPLLLWGKRKAIFSTIYDLISKKPTFLLYEDTMESAQFNPNIFSKYNILTPNFEGTKKTGGLGSTQYYFDYSEKDIVKREIKFSEFFPTYPSTTVYANYEKTFE